MAPKVEKGDTSVEVSLREFVSTGGVEQHVEKRHQAIGTVTTLYASGRHATGLVRQSPFSSARDGPQGGAEGTSNAQRPSWPLRTYSPPSTKEGPAMRTQMIRFILAGVIGLSLVQPTVATDYAATDYLPLAVGNSWTYSHNYGCSLVFTLPFSGLL